MLGATSQAVKGATLETHAAWRQQLNTMAGTLVLSGVLVLALIVLATVLAVMFATRGTMASNREIVDVLHFIGASNSFIAGEFQGRFLSLGFRGGLDRRASARCCSFSSSLGATGSIVPDQATRPARLPVRALFARHSTALLGSPQWCR